MVPLYSVFTSPENFGASVPTTSMLSFTLPGATFATSTATGGRSDAEGSPDVREQADSTRTERVRATTDLRVIGGSPSFREESVRVRWTGTRKVARRVDTGFAHAGV